MKNGKVQYENFPDISDDEFKKVVPEQIDVEMLITQKIKQLCALGGPLYDNMPQHCSPEEQQELDAKFRNKCREYGIIFTRPSSYGPLADSYKVWKARIERAISV